LSPLAVSPSAPFSVAPSIPGGRGSDAASPSFLGASEPGGAASPSSSEESEEEDVEEEEELLDLLRFLWPLESSDGGEFRLLVRGGNLHSSRDNLADISEPQVPPNEQKHP